MYLLVAILCGLLFGIGLAISDLINPTRVLAFLDVAGDWDPTLAFVMAGALIPAALGYLIKRRMPRPILSDAFHVPTSRMIDRRLIGGAVLFGIGWGLVGLCPGPAIAVLTTAQWQAFVYAAAMVAGMVLFKLAEDHAGSVRNYLSGGVQKSAN